MPRRLTPRQNEALKAAIKYGTPAQSTPSTGRSEHLGREGRPDQGCQAIGTSEESSRQREQTFMLFLARAVVNVTTADT